MRGISSVSRILFVLLMLFCAIPVFSEEPVEEASKAASHVERAISGISQSDSGEGILKVFNEAVSDFKTYDDYEAFAAGIREMISGKAGFTGLDILYFVAAETRLKQLEFLTKQNDIVSGRIYMSVNNQYYDEALENLDKALAIAKSKELILDIMLRRFTVYTEKFQTQKADEAFEGLTAAISSYSESSTKTKGQLMRVADQFNMRGLPDYALKLKLAYASKTDPLTAQEVMEDIRSSADQAFIKGDMGLANTLYGRYIKEARTYLTKESLAPKVMAIAEKYYAAGRYKEARAYYEFHREAFPDSEVKDYCDYKIALSLYEEKDIQKAVAQLEGFLDLYKNSVWFDKAFEMLSRIYYTNYLPENAITNLHAVIDKYYRKNTGDYARVLAALVYYGDKKYDKALEELKRIEPASIYFYSAEMITDDIAQIKKRKAPTFGSASKDTYRIWEPYFDLSLTVTPYKMDGQDRLEYAVKDNTLELAVDPNTKVRFEIETVEDLDKFAEYLQDKEDLSRLPKKIREYTEKDILSIEWTSDSGSFLDEKQSRSKGWQAPQSPGRFKVSLRVDDFGLVRSPDKGSRKDRTKEVSFVIVVK